MFRKFKKTKGQNTAEYAILIALVIGAVIAMQVYMQRSIQAKMRDAGSFMTTSNSMGQAFPGVDNSKSQYEPYYKASNYETTRDSDEFSSLNATEAGAGSTADTTRAVNGYEKTSYNTSDNSNW
jgi:Flp pilus assembly pilin Flp